LQSVVSDAALVARAVMGDAGGFAELIDRHHSACARYARRMLGNAQDAEDVVQETFLRAYVALQRYREQDRFKSWLFRILVNQCRSHARRHAREARRLVDDPDAEAATPPGAGEENGPDDALQAALDELEPLLREALLLKYGEELAYEEMARVTGANVSALKMRVKRARDAVRPLLKERKRE
jgi:RNA polymerase sigma-70 factor (ECF subfamily)